MTLTIELKDQLAEKAQRIAQKNGKTVTELVEVLLQKLRKTNLNPSLTGLTASPPGFHFLPTSTPEKSTTRP